MAQYVVIFARAHSQAYCVGDFKLARVAFPLELQAADKLGPHAHKRKINHNIGAQLTHIC